MTWQELSIVRHENEAVLASLRDAPHLSRAERAARLGLGQLALAIILRRLERGGLL